MENGGDMVAGEILDLSSRTAEPIAASPLRWRAFAMVGWTGEEVIVTGGSNGPGIDVSGAAYDPSADSWRRISDPPGFEPGVSDNQAIGPGVWTGTELISWQSGLAYNPANDSWREIAPSPLTARMDEAVTATNGDVLVWGGCDRESVPNCDDALEVPLSDGAIYDPENDVWTMLPDGPLDGGAGAMAVDTSWDGRVVVVVPHPVEPDASTVAAIDPISLEWTELPPLPDGAGKRSSALTWTGTDVVIWGGYTESYTRGDRRRLHAQPIAWEVARTRTWGRSEARTRSGLDPARPPDRRRQPNLSASPLRSARLDSHSICARKSPDAASPMRRWRRSNSREHEGSWDTRNCVRTERSITRSREVGSRCGVVVRAAGRR